MAKAQPLVRELQKRLGQAFQENVSLRDVLASRVGGVADYYFPATTVDELMKAVTAARAVGVPYHILGSGLQTIVSDIGYPGFLIQNLSQRIQFVPNSGQVITDSGVGWPQLILAAAGNNLSGLEALLTVPGTVGGTVWQHRMAYTGYDVRTAVRQLTVLDGQGVVRQLSGLGLTAHRFSKETILVSTLQFIQTRRDEVVRRVAVFERQRRQFGGRERRWLGPVFANREDIGNPASFTAIFEKSRVRGLRVGGAVFSTDRSNYIEIDGRAAARDIRALITLVYDKLADDLIRQDLICQLRFIGVWDEDQD